MSPPPLSDALALVTCALRLASRDPAGGAAPAPRPGPADDPACGAPTRLRPGPARELPAALRPRLRPGLLGGTSGGALAQRLPLLETGSSFWQVLRHPLARALED